MTEYTLRKASHNDLKLSYEIRKNSLGEYVTQTWGWDEDWQWEYHKKDFNPDIMFIIEVEGKPAGMLEEEISENDIRISGLYLLNTFQSQGIGRDLVEKLISYARLHRKPLKLQVLKVNTRARNFYEALGFVVYEETEHHYQMRFEV